MDINIYNFRYNGQTTIAEKIKNSTMKKFFKYRNVPGINAISKVVNYITYLLLYITSRSSYSRCYTKKVLLKILQNFTRN